MPAGPVLALGNPRRYHSSGMLKFQEDSSRQRCCTFHSQKHQEALSPQYPSVLSPHPDSLLFQLPPSILPSLAFIPYSGEKHSWPFCNERPTKMHPVISEHPPTPANTHVYVNESLPSTQCTVSVRFLGNGQPVPSEMYVLRPHKTLWKQ